MFGNYYTFIAIDCGDPGVPAHSIKQGSAYTYPSTVSYTCQSGYTKSAGSEQRSCQESGSWSGQDIVCSSKNLI